MRLWRQWRLRILLFLAVLGPGIITANVDNDTGGIFTYSQAGAQYGLLLLWTILPVTLALIVVQEMSARMGVVTGKGLSDLIREEFGLRMTFGDCELRQRGLGVQWRRGIDATVPREQVHQRANLRGDCVGAGGQGRLQDRGEVLSGGQRHLPCVHWGGRGEPSRLA
jgi:hypothetical protein